MTDAGFSSQIFLAKCVTELLEVSGYTCTVRKQELPAPRLPGQLLVQKRIKTQILPKQEKIHENCMVINEMSHFNDGGEGNIMPEYL